ncbi:MAG: hypothetical protein ACYDAO_02545 [Thermoplasmataceae archaeon]
MPKVSVSIYVDDRYIKKAESLGKSFSDFANEALSLTDMEINDLPIVGKTSIRVSSRTLAILKSLKKNMSYDRFLYMHFRDLNTGTLEDRIGKILPGVYITSDHGFIFVYCKPGDLILFQNVGIEATYDHDMGYAVIFR